MESKQPETQQLHLHTLESLCNDLVGGHAVEYGDEGKLFKLSNNSRSILEWYRSNIDKWKKNLQSADAKAIVASIENEPPELEPFKIATSGNANKRLTLVKIEVHRFAGIHAYGKESEAPGTYIFEPTKSITLFEGWNGSGKTSLVNAVIWCLTGELIRPQRAPERGDIEYDLEILHDGEDSSPHTLPPVTPLPRTDTYIPDAATIKVPVDTWVELTFKGQDGNLLSPIRRSISRTNRGKIQETEPQLSNLDIDPISFRIGTTMPALIPFIRIGEKSELGQAVAELTGLSSLIYLSKHADKVINKVSGDLTDISESSLSKSDESYSKLKSELEEKFVEYPSIKPVENIPVISENSEIEIHLNVIKEHLESCKAQSFTEAKKILGDNFDPDDNEVRKELETKITPALSKIGEIKDLPSALRLSSLGSLTNEQIESVENLIAKILDEAQVLSELTSQPKIAERKRLYARVIAWIQEYDDVSKEIDNCPVCNNDLEEIIDPVTGTPVKQHLKDALDSDSKLISQTIAAWINASLGALSKDLPQALHSELSKDLPDNPIVLVKSAIIDELFSTPPFSGVLFSLKAGMNELYENVVTKIERIDGTGSKKLPQSISAAGKKLQNDIDRIQRAISFSRWRNSNKSELKDIFIKVIGSPSPILERESTGITVNSPLTIRLESILEITKSAIPINECLEKLSDMERFLKSRRQEENLLKKYIETIQALHSITKLGELAAQQVKDLQSKLQDSTQKWRDRVYLNAYSKSGHALADTNVAPEGALSITVGSNGVLAPAQHVSNASALRASLFGFYIAFWEYVIKQRGGLQLMILDDPQELLDEENEERLAETLPELAKINAQLFVTTHDQQFATMVARVGTSSGMIEHRSVHPVNIDRPILQTPLAVGDLENKKNEYLRDKDDSTVSQDYLAECRIFIEARLADLFNDPAYTSNNHKPTLSTYLGKARSLMKHNPGHELFNSVAVRRFCNDAALQDGSECLKLLNKSHHEAKRSIMPSEINGISEDLNRLTKLSENLHTEFRQWRRREPTTTNVSSINKNTIKPINKPELNVSIFPDLAAFTTQSPVEASQDVDDELFSGNWFIDKALFYLRNDMFGFSAPAGSIVIVEIDEEPPSDQSLVIAKYKGKTLARRLLRDNINSGIVTLATVTSDPKMRPPSIVVPVNEVQLYRVVGVLFNGIPPSGISNKHDAIQLESTDIMEKIKTCHRVKDNSAVPLALNNQLVLGGTELKSDKLSSHEGTYVALSLKGGGGLFKRVGKVLPGELKHLCQFESIGGQGSSEIVALGEPPSFSNEFPVIESARLVVGVIYES